MFAPDTASERFELKVAITDHQGNMLPGLVQVAKWHRKQRLQRALKWGGLCWLAALGSVILPLAHFFLVPGFFLAGVVVPFLLWGQEAMILGGQGICPHCQAELPIALTAFGFPFSEYCDHCRSELKIALEAVEPQTATTKTATPG